MIAVAPAAVAVAHFHIVCDAFSHVVTAPHAFAIQATIPLTDTTTNTPPPPHSTAHAMGSVAPTSSLDGSRHGLHRAHEVLRRDGVVLSEKRETITADVHQLGGARHAFRHKTHVGEGLEEVREHLADRRVGGEQRGQPVVERARLQVAPPWELIFAVELLAISSGKRERHRGFNKKNL